MGKVWIASGGRQRGRTTAQIKGAPIGAVYLAHDKAACDYVRGIAKKEGREDLKIKAPVDFLDGRQWVGQRLEVIVDHAAFEYLSPLEVAELRKMFAYLASHKSA